MHNIAGAAFFGWRWPCSGEKGYYLGEGGADGEGLKGESIRCSNWVYYRTWQTARLGTMHFTSRAVMTNLVISHLTSFYGRTLVLSFCGKRHVTVRWKGLLYAEPGRRTRAGGMLCYVSSSLQVLLFSPFLLNVTNRADLKLFNDGEQTMGLQWRQATSTHDRIRGGLRVQVKQQPWWQAAGFLGMDTNWSCVDVI